MKTYNELWIIAYHYNFNGEQKTALITASLTTKKHIAKEWAKTNKKYLKDKDWVILKYELSEDF